MAKNIYKSRNVIVFFLLFLVSCKNDTLNGNQEKGNQKKDENLVKEIADVDSAVFVKNETAKLNEKGLKLAEKGNVKEAKKMFQKSLKMEPNNAASYNNLALIAVNEDDINLAMDYFKKAIYYDSSYFPAYINYSSLLIENDYFKRSVDINNYLIKVDAKKEDLILAFYFNTFAFLKMGNCDLANENCKKAKELIQVNKDLEQSLKQFEVEIKKCLSKN